ncbi:MAG TPA: D-aminoacyl-tRNA deacylase [Sedimentisphaerales bacterium]|nr:D-aminoacyl-tRNA deacylase [Sedimentisphaerales bacterium]
MRAVVQRVLNAKVEVEGKIVGATGNGLLVYLGVGREDNEKDARYVAEKILNLRIFSDAQCKMNLSVKDVGGSVLLVSQFTLYGDCRKGRRPGFDDSAEPDLAKELYIQVGDIIKNGGISVENGIFASHMVVSSVNDGPINFLIDSSKLF